MRLILTLSIIALAGCETPVLQGQPTTAAPGSVATMTPAPPPPPQNAVTVEQFDTTTATDRAAAVATPPAGAQALGTTIASLGSPAEAGIWLKTPLVTAPTPGRVDYQGKSINIALRPSGGVAGSGSQISLAAMRLIAAPLTSLPELTVYAIP